MIADQYEETWVSAEELKEKIIVTCPSGSTTYVGKVQKAFKRFYFKKPKEIYLQLIKESGFGLSFAISLNSLTSS